MALKKVRKKTYRKGICAVIFRRTKIGPFFLIFHRIQNWTGWELLKGGIRPGETEKACLFRELREETGARRFKIHARTPAIIKYRWPRWFKKDQKLYHGSVERVYLIEIFDKKIKIDRSEHDSYRWVREKDLYKLLTYKERKDAFKYVIKNYSKFIFK